MKAHDAKVCGTDAKSCNSSNKNSYTSLVNDKSMFKRAGKAAKKFTPLNTHREWIWHEVFHLHNIPTMLALRFEVMGSKLEKLCNSIEIKGIILTTATS